eukprot:4752412-Pleurochrysis_carterae.AAC.1
MSEWTAVTGPGAARLLPIAPSRGGAVESREWVAARKVHFRTTPLALAIPAPPPSPRPPKSCAGRAALPPHAVGVEHVSPPLAVDAGHVEARPSAVGVAVAVP